MCFGCLSQGHINRNCVARLTCEIFKQSHPSVLHINRSPAPGTPEPVPISHTTCDHTGAGNGHALLSVLPV